jgi:putative membrane protein
VTPSLPAHPPENMATWHRLHPLSPLVRTGRHLVGLAFVVLILIFANHGSGSGSGGSGNLTVDIVVVGVVLVAGVVSWLVTRWQVAGGVLLIETGLIRRQSLRFPLSQVQAIDVVQTGLARTLGLAELRLRMAGADSSGGRLACLRLADAERLRARLLAIGHAAAPAAAEAGAPASVAAPRGPERELFRVQSERLAGAIILSSSGASAGVVIAAVVVIISLTGRPGVIVPFLALGLGVVLNVWRRFNTEFATVVAETPDGLRLRSGLVQTAAETIRPGRVQAVRIVEPLCWRAFGWCRLEVDVAGPRQRRENRSEGQRLRALIPVGSRADADRVLRELLTAPPPRGGRRRSPITFWPGRVTTTTPRPPAAGYAGRPPGCRWRRCRASAGFRARSSAGSVSPRSGWTSRAGG